MVEDGLETLQLRRHYDSDEEDVMNTFYRPVLGRSISYRRAVGYFSAAALLACARELAHFIKGGGSLKFIVGCFVSRQEIEAVPLDQRDELEREIIRQELIKQLQALEDVDFDAAALLAKLISSGVAELRIAVRDNGLYHEKYGIFEDVYGSKIAFIGSANETLAALTQGSNHESFSAYSSSEPHIYEAYGAVLEARFEKLWTGDAKGTRVLALDPTTLEYLQQLAARARSADASDADAPPLPTIAPASTLRGYQLDALRNWQNNEFQGILAMATGTGKTITAIEAIKKFRGAVPYGAIIITVPYQNLAVQWIEAVREAGIDSIAAFQSRSNWYSAVKNVFLAARTGHTQMPCVICVNDTFEGSEFQELLALLKDAVEQRHLIIVDECHHFNNLRRIHRLPSWFRLRLGLSATPYDQYAEHILDQYFGKIVFEFTLKEAIANDYLTKYRYQVFPCMLTEEETELYEEVTYKIVRTAGGREDGFTPEVFAKVKHLLLQRARIVGAARNKLTSLRAHLSATGKTPYSLFYCGDGSLEEEGDSIRQIILVTRLLSELGWRTSRITAAETLNEREALLSRLETRALDAIVSIKVLDEGIDIPICQTAYILASQTSDRQGIQRRGRVLRKSDGKELAYLYDFLVLGGSTSSNALKNLAHKEIRRARQFAADAVNADSLESKLNALEELI
jgi:superfamily II DNA or RNA helicase/HKD family nuclease